MTCRGVRARLSAVLEGDLRGREAQRVSRHLAGCAACTRHLRELREVSGLLQDLPYAQAPEPVASRVLARLEVETRGPGLSLIFRPFWAARPLFLPSLVPATLVLMSVLAGALALDQNVGEHGRMGPLSAEAWEPRLPASGTEANPLFPHTGVEVPRHRTPRTFPQGDLESGEGSFFLETVVARDGSVSAVTLIDGDRSLAGPLLDLLRNERFEPTRRAGRPVAVAVYRLISRLEVRAPRT